MNQSYLDQISSGVNKYEQINMQNKSGASANAAPKNQAKVFYPTFPNFRETGFVNEKIEK